MKLVNFWVSFQAVTKKSKTMTTITKHTGPMKLQRRWSPGDIQQLMRRKGTYVHFFKSTRWITAEVCMCKSTHCKSVSVNHSDRCCKTYYWLAPYFSGITMADIMTITMGVPYPVTNKYKSGMVALVALNSWTTMRYNCTSSNSIQIKTPKKNIWNIAETNLQLPCHVI